MYLEEEIVEWVLRLIREGRDVPLCPKCGVAVRSYLSGWGIYDNIKGGELVDFEPRDDVPECCEECNSDVYWACDLEDIVDFLSEIAKDVPLARKILKRFYEEGILEDENIKRMVAILI